MDSFLVAENPQPDSRLPFLLRLPIEGGLILKAKETWPRSSRVFCHPFEESWPEDAKVLEDVPVKLCRRRGSAIDLVLKRGANYRSQFVFTTFRGRPMIFWQTARVVKNARPGVRVPGRRASGMSEWVIEVDTRERYPYRFVGRPVTIDRVALPVGDYAVRSGDFLIAAVERKTSEGFQASLSNGTLVFVMAELAGLVAGAVVVEDRYSALMRAEHVSPGWLLDLVARLQVRYPSVPVVFCESRKLAEEWTYRFLGAALAEFGPALELNG